MSYLISDKPILSMVAEMLDKTFVKIPNGMNLISNLTKAGSTTQTIQENAERKKEFGRARAAMETV